MKIVCVQPAQLRIEGKVLTFHRGEVTEYDGKDVPACFEKVGEREPNFANDSAALLEASDWSVSDARKAVKELYGIVLKTKGKSRDNIIEQIIDARNRNVEVTPTPKVAAKAKFGKK